MKRLFLVMCVAGLANLAALSHAQAQAMPGGAEAGPVERIPFRAGVSSTTVEKMALEQGCTGAASQGAGLMTPQGPVEIYRMVCDSQKIFMARCEFRQCRPMTVPPAGGYGTPAEGMQYGARGMLGPREVPKLDILWGCSGCKSNERVPALIRAAYFQAAQAAGYKVSPAETANVSIVQYAERQPTLRTMLGKLAGSDMISTEITFRGQRTIAQDMATESTVTIDMVGEHIGQQAFRQLTARAR